MKFKFSVETAQLRKHSADCSNARKKLSDIVLILNNAENDLPESSDFREIRSQIQSKIWDLEKLEDDLEGLSAVMWEAAGLYEEAEDRTIIRPK
ncbi:MAG: hypothetical protein SOH60_03810 [Lachnospiraceae bacterium]|jgi:predicted MarR family transcription regulator